LNYTRVRLLGDKLTVFSISFPLKLCCRSILVASATAHSF